MDPDIMRLILVPNFAVLTTLGPHGEPSSHVTWVDCSHEHLLVNTEVHRQKMRNVTRDPRVAVTVLDSESPYKFIEVRGIVTESTTGTEAREHIDALARRYTGADYAPRIVGERVILRIDVVKLYKKRRPRGTATADGRSREQWSAALEELACILNRATTSVAGGPRGLSADASPL